MEYEKHWRQRLSVTIVCGRVVAVAAAVERSEWQRRDPRGDLRALPRLNGL
jgi:hypothetical protein